MVAQKDYEIQKHVLQDTLTNERKIRAAIEEEYRVKTKVCLISVCTINNCINGRLSRRTRKQFELAKLL